VVCKLTEHVLSTHIRGHLERFGILTPANYGFRSKHSCESQLLSFLSCRQQLVLCDGTRSEHFAVTTRVPQGTVMKPLLFLFYINDMPLVVDLGTSLRLFANDTLI